jgi:hypothetical protein
MGAERFEVLLEEARRRTDPEGREVSAAKPSHLLIPRKGQPMEISPIQPEKNLNDAPLPE